MYKKYYVKVSGVKTPKKNVESFLTSMFIITNSLVLAFGLVLIDPIKLLDNRQVAVTHDVPEVQGVMDVQVVPTDLIPSEVTQPPEILTPTDLPTPTPSPTPAQTKKSSYKIAVYGDSMVDTMGELMEYLDHSLKKKYPKTTFGLYNFGIGSENVEEGLKRFHREFSYQTRKYPTVIDVHPDIIILGSYAYNPFYPHDRDRHWLGLTHLVQEAQKTGANVYMLAEIAPTKQDFGRGPNGVNWSRDASYTQAMHIEEQLNNAIGLSRTLGVPLIDAYSKSLNSQHEGIKKYINASDNIHPSVQGHEFTADIIADSLDLAK